MIFIDFNLFTKLFYGLTFRRMAFALLLPRVNENGAARLPQTPLPQTAGYSWAERTGILTNVVPVELEASLPDMCPRGSKSRCRKCSLQCYFTLVKSWKGPKCSTLGKQLNELTPPPPGKQTNKKTSKQTNKQTPQSNRQQKRKSSGAQNRGNLTSEPWAEEELSDPREGWAYRCV